MMTYEEFTKTIEQKRRFGKACGRDVMQSVLPRFHNPERGMKLIHIAGTNGKGSTAAFVSSILQAAGFRVGLFTSPHLVRFTERIRLNGNEIPKEDVVRLGGMLMNTDWGCEGTMFDDCLLLALLYFKEQAPDYVVLETGLGGRLDSTNGLSETPVVSVITRIGYDHTAVLGETLSAIAGEKAGILKPGTKAVIAEMDEEPRRVLVERCKELHIPYVLSRAEEISAPLGLWGVHQKENAANAVAAVRLLFGESGATLAENRVRLDEAIVAGLKNAFIPGRMELLLREPFLLIDGAHNPQGVQALSKSLSALYPGERFFFVCGILSDKAYQKMLREIAPLAEHFFAVTAPGERALSAKELAEVIERETGRTAEAYPDITAGVQAALQMEKTTGTKVVVFGSLYLIGEVRSQFISYSY